MKLGMTDMVTYDGAEVKNLYVLVAATFSSLPFVLFYVASMAVIGMHLYHGFQSAFQTFGWNHKKYFPVIEKAGTIYAVLMAVGFASIPIYFYLNGGN